MTTFTEVNWCCFVVTLLACQCPDIQADVDDPRPLTDYPKALLKVRRSVAMELLWVQHAMDSRKHYTSIRRDYIGITL
ncbi:hypothetical protein DPMN_193251 [Dreissena polymorpha]|uniref:Uncharacterized protein n=1 Tax=Dreissena polymorpha TaxID=45954 RepID=A0A9D3Y5D5_DREPO|nr:hypothetical protein DPMN_193251 [Dreissena polymorpha]